MTAINGTNPTASPKSLGPLFLLILASAGCSSCKLSKSSLTKQEKQDFVANYYVKVVEMPGGGI